MNSEIANLNKKIKFILKARELPEEIKNTIEGVFQEYKALYEQYMKEENRLSEQYVAFRNVDEYFESNKLEANHRINNEYKEKCEDKAEIITMIISTFEPKDDKNKDTEIEESEKDVLSKCIINSKENHLYIERITNSVIDSIENSKNQWFRVLESLRTSHQRKEYIYSQIKLIENSAKLKIGSLKELLEIDDRRIFDQIMSEYENYRCNRQENSESEKNEHQKFVDEYKVSQEELQKNAQIQENINQQNKKVQENIDLPGNVIE